MQLLVKGEGCLRDHRDLDTVGLHAFCALFKISMERKADLVIAYRHDLHKLTPPCPHLHRKREPVPQISAVDHDHRPVQMLVDIMELLLLRVVLTPINCHDTSLRAMSGTGMRRQAYEARDASFVEECLLLNMFVPR